MGVLLITGATGFVGSQLIEAVARNGLRARALVRKTSDLALLERHGVERAVGDITDPAALRRAVEGAETVLHLAAATRALRAATFHAVNGEATGRLVEAMEADGERRRLVYLSSLAAAGPRRDRPVRPDDPPRPVTSYGQSKLEGERAALGSVTLSVAVLRAPAVYGPGDRDLLPFFRLAQRGVLPLVGAPDRRLQLVHVRDLAESLLTAAASEATGIFHIAEPRAYRWAEVVDLLGKAVDQRGVRVPVPAMIVRGAAALSEKVARLRGEPVIFDRDKAREILAAGWLCETDRARRDLGFEARVSLEQGLRETTAWYRAYGWLPPVRE
ncbi:MAG: NAD-dependent epimerase/dehydratase family protein [Gemmatimonadetes bacterium]|nr:NAD-dependent epimerase/dehydratase family protein [Gemmatimonadota bacterium]